MPHGRPVDSSHTAPCLKIRFSRVDDARVRSRKLCRRKDSGFTLVEAVVSLSIATMVFLALATSLAAGIKGTALSRQNQQAGDALNQTLEVLRSQPVAAVAMRSSDPGLTGLSSTGDPAGLAGCSCYNPATDSATGATEPLIISTVGGVSPHVTTLSQNNTTFTIRRYITQPTDQDSAVYRRATVIVSWFAYGITHHRSAGTLLTFTRRGLPLPDFKFTPVGPTTKCLGVGATAAFGLRVVNNGARDSWLITSSGSSLSWTYYKDNGDGVYDSTVDTALLPADSTTGGPSTGSLDPTTGIAFWAVSSLPSSVTPPVTYSTTFTATSAAQSTYSQPIPTTTVEQSTACSSAPSPSPSPTPSTTTTPSPSASPTTSPPAQPSICTPAAAQSQAAHGGSTLNSYSLYSNTVTTNSVAVSPLAFGLLTPSTSNLYDYSTDLHTVGPTAGRVLKGSSGAGGSPPTSLVDWRFTPSPSAKFFDSTLRVWVQNAGATTLTATLGSYSSANGYAPWQSGSTAVAVAASGCFHAVDIPLAGPGNGNGNGDSTGPNVQMSLRLTSTTDVTLAYGVQSANSTLLVPVS